MYKTLDPFRTWCKTVLPLVYDDSLSYYELLTIMVNYVNDIIREIKHINPILTDLINQMEKLKKRLDNLITEISGMVEEEVQAYLNEMVESGAFADILIDDTVESLTKTWSSTKISEQLALKASASDIPTKTSELQNDSGFITGTDVPTKLSDLTNDEDFIGFVDVTGTLTAGNTSITLSNVAITTNSTIDIFSSVYGVNPTDVTVSSGSVVLTFEAQQTDVAVKVRVS